LQTALRKALESGESPQQAVAQLLQDFEALGQLLEAEATRQQVLEPNHVLPRFSIAQLVVTRDQPDVPQQLRDAVSAWKHEQQLTEMQAFASSGDESQDEEAEVDEEEDLGPLRQPSSSLQRTSRRDAQSVLVRVSGHPDQLVNCEYAASGQLHAGQPRFESESGRHLYFCPQPAGWVLNDVWQPQPAMDTNGVQAYLRAAGLGGWYELLREKLPAETMARVEALRSVSKSTLEPAVGGCGVWMFRQLEAACVESEEALEPFLEARGYEEYSVADLRACNISTPAQLLAIPEDDVESNIQKLPTSAADQLAEYMTSCGLGAWHERFRKHTCVCVCRLLSAVCYCGCH
jgi:hypothetical protein